MKNTDQDNGKRPYKRKTTREPGVKKPKYGQRQSVLDLNNGMKNVRTDNRGPPSKAAGNSSLQHSTDGHQSVSRRSSSVAASRASIADTPETNPAGQENSYSFFMTFTDDSLSAVALVMENLVSTMKFAHRQSLWNGEIPYARTLPSSTRFCLSGSQWQILKDLHNLLLSEGKDFISISSHLESVPASKLCELRDQHTILEWSLGIANTLLILNHRTICPYNELIPFIYAVQAWARVQSTKLSDGGAWLKIWNTLESYRVSIEDAELASCKLSSRSLDLWAQSDSTADNLFQTIIRNRLAKLLGDRHLIGNLEHLMLTKQHLTSHDIIIPESDGLRNDTSLESVMMMHRRLLLVPPLANLMWKIVLYKPGPGDPDFSDSGIRASLQCPPQAVHELSELQLPGVIPFFIALNLSRAILAITQHPQASKEVRRLAEEHQIPASIWQNGLHPLLEEVKKNGNTEDMLHWLEYGYDYIKSLRKVAPDLELDWEKCERGLDIYRAELEKSLVEQPLSGISTSPILSPSPYEGAGALQHATDSVNQETTPESFEQYIAPCTSGDGSNELDTRRGNLVQDKENLDSSTVDACASYGDSEYINSGKTGTENEPASYLTSDQWQADLLSPHDADLLDKASATNTTISPPVLEQHHEKAQPLFTIDEWKDCLLQNATDKLMRLSINELSKLKDLVLQGWSVIGQAFDSNIYTKVHSILSRCCLRLEQVVAA